MTKGNFKEGIPKGWDNHFNTMAYVLVSQAPRRHRRSYTPSQRGVAAALGLDLNTFNRYYSGKQKAPDVVFEHINLLFLNKAPGPEYWDGVELLRITPVMELDEATGLAACMFRVLFSPPGTRELFDRTTKKIRFSPQHEV